MRALHEDPSDWILLEYSLQQFGGLASKVKYLHDAAQQFKKPFSTSNVLREQTIVTRVDIIMSKFNFGDRGCPFADHVYATRKESEK